MILLKIRNILLPYGEWGIKLKNKDLMKKTIINFLIKMLIWTVSFPVVFIVFYFIISRLDFQWIYDSSPKVYYDVKNLVDNLSNGYIPFNILVIILYIWFFGLGIMLYFLIKKFFSYINAISLASENLLNKDVEYINLPKELENLQDKMNHLKN